MADLGNARQRGRDEPDSGDQDDFLQLVTYQSWAEVDMLLPRLEDDGVRYEVRELSPSPEERSDGIEPRTVIQILVPHDQMRQAREVLEDFEAQADVVNFEMRARPEPEDVGRPEDMQEPPQPKMKF
jgi:hypothetical protein